GGAVEVGGEGRADAFDRFAQAGTLAGQLVEAPLQLGGHGVELAAKLRELVASLDRNRGGEVTAADALGGGEEARDLSVKLAGDGQRSGEREQQEEREQGEGERAFARGGDGGGGRVGEDDDRDAAAAAEVGGREGGGCVRDVRERAGAGACWRGRRGRAR